mgnify:CR=1 FL=1
MDIFYCFLGVLSPNNFIYPHTDDHEQNNYNKDFLCYKGCTQLYIPLKWPKGSSLKFGNVGELPFEKGPLVINNDYFTHAGINPSDEYRYVLAIRSHRSIIDNCTIRGTYE